MSKCSTDSIFKVARLYTYLSTKAAQVLNSSAMEVEKARLFRLTVVIINRFDNVAQRELIEDLLFLLRILHGRLHGYASKAKSFFALHKVHDCCQGRIVISAVC